MQQGFPRGVTAVSLCFGGCMAVAAWSGSGEEGVRVCGREQGEELQRGGRGAGTRGSHAGTLPGLGSHFSPGATEWGPGPGDLARTGTVWWGWERQGAGQTEDGTARGQQPALAWLGDSFQAQGRGQLSALLILSAAAVCVPRLGPGLVWEALAAPHEPLSDSSFWHCSLRQPLS